MVRDAESHADEDRSRREEADARNRAETLLYQTEKLLADQGDKVPGDQKAAVEAALVDVRSSLNDGDSAAINTATEALMAASQQLSQSLYEQASANDAAGQPGTDGPAQDAPSDDEVVDAEIIEDDK
jgi:molecular chaperone DnaK